MATRRTEITPAGKEKRGTSPLNTAKPRGRSPTTKSTSPASEKHIPNYLKPTISSSSSTDKPKHTRKVSFEKTPSKSRTQRSRVVSPGPSHKLSDKNLKTPTKDAGKQHSLYARPVTSAIKKSVKKQEIVGIAPNEEVENLDASIVQQPEIKPEYQELSVTQDEVHTEHDESENENEIEKGYEELVKEDHQEKTNTEQTEVEIDNQDGLAHEDASIGIETEEKEENLPIEETGIKHEELEEHTENEKQKELEGNNINEITSTDETVAEIPKDEIELIKKDEEIEAHEEKQVAEEKKQDASGNEAHESKQRKAVEEKKQEDSVIEAHGVEETEVIEENKEEANESEESKVVEEKKQEEATKQQTTQGNNDSAVSNNTEDTANKLRGQRRNKVKVLAGAFESTMQ